MPSFKETIQQLEEARSSQSASQAGFSQSRERLNRIRKQREALERKVNDNSDDYVAELNKLKAAEKEALTALNQQKEQLAGAKGISAGLYKDFIKLSDPRQQLHNLDDGIPLLLFPVRIETRFKKVRQDNEVTDELWIRIYPDDALVDTFEETLSETEVKNAVFYWQKHWEAAGNEEQERGAWRTLVSNHGSGRAFHILERYAPQNPADAPVKANAEDVVLVVTGPALPTQPERDALVKYWAEVWRVTGDAAKEQQAWNTLVADAGGEASAQALREKYTPFNMDALPPVPKTKADVQVSLAFLQLPAPESVPTKAQSWSEAPFVNMLPERFVVTGYQGTEVAFERLGNHIPSPLYVAPDPGTSEEEQFSQDGNGEIIMPEELQWMVDFNVAVQNGLGLKVPISATQAARGFTRIVVLGVRLSADEYKGKEMVETLLEHHRRSRKGIAIIPQGTPTNNTESDSAGHQSLDDADESFNLLKKGRLFEPATSWIDKKDGQWLAESLGLSYDAVNRISNADQADTAEARMMNTALWPATMGYMMETLMQPVFSDNDIAATRSFFNQFVSGRGQIPALKIGRQPYGILPATGFANIKWLSRQPAATHLNVAAGTSYLFKLYNILKETDKEWQALVSKVSHVGKAGDGHQILLDALGLNPASVEYYQRTAESKQDIFNRFNLMGLGGALLALFLTGGYVKTGMDLLKKFGYTEAEVPEILDKFFLQSQNQLKGPLIDDRPLSETALIRNYTTDNKNYIQWLINAVNTSHDTLRKQQGFINGKIPNALLYLMLHHALDLSYVEVSLRLYQKAALLTSEQVRAAKIEPAFLHISQKAQTSESRWNYLYSRQPVITGNADQYIGDYIPKIIKTEVASQYMKEQLEALEKLKDLPTARLERIFAEHIDCCSYRLDAWQSGILHYQLSLMRQRMSDSEEEYKQGIYIGAFGWVEEVKSENKVLTPVQLEDPALKKMFIDGQTIPLERDSTNGGYITAPSLDHAVAASVLRNAYTANKNPESLRVNLSSERVRKALSVIEGIRGGQSMGALLGYYLERGLHEGYPGVELDYFIYQLRKAFPLVVNKVKDTKLNDGDGDEVEVIEARNVIDGLALVNHVTQTGNTAYPFGKTLPPLENAAQGTAITKEVNKIMDINDAVGDLAISESVYQAVLANYERSNATLDTFSDANFPPIPEVVQTPRSGINLTHRVGLHLKPGLAANPAHTPRAKAEPAMNEWLQTVLPAPADIVCFVSYGAVTDEEVSAATLGLQPLDLLYMINTDSDQALREIDDRLLKFVMDKGGVRPDVAVSINYMKQAAGKYSFFELAPLFNSLRTLLLRSRPLTPNDVSIAIDAKAEEDNAVFADNNLARLQAARNELQQQLNNDLTPYINTIEPLLTADLSVPANVTAVINALDASFIQPALPVFSALAKAGLIEAGYGFMYTRRKEIFLQLLNKTAALTTKWDGKLAAYDALITDYAALPGTATAEEKMRFLQDAELQLSTIVRTTLPATPADYLNALQTTIRPAFEAKLNDLKTVQATAATTLLALLNEVKGKLPVDQFDAEAFDLKDVENQFVVLAGEILAAAKALAASLVKRIAAADALLAEVPAVTDNKKKVKLVMDAAVHLFHEDFKVVPEFGVTAAAGAEWNNAVAARSQLFSYLTTPDGDGNVLSEFPEDDWLYGIARVREKLHHWENLVLLSPAFQKTAPELHPVQLPYQANDSWLALEYPANYSINTDRLLYTAHYSTPFDRNARQCGLLLDEWTEIIPSGNETAGVAFHYDRPNAEPPQAILLALPTEFTGEWKWNDLLNTVNETLNAAKKRAVEPAQVDTTSYARFLPAIVSSMTVHPLSVSLNLAFNNNIHEILLNQGQ
ncbi:hypothetical protein [Chitinophaga sp.]|uniref:hypothetical protein n=1 Tax=Chitinophaga sp. TaxID=1869181 RepID=UPI0031E3E095